MTNRSRTPVLKVLKNMFLKCTGAVQELMFMKYSRTVSRANVLEVFLNYVCELFKNSFKKLSRILVLKICPILRVLEHFKSSSCPVLEPLFLKCTRKVQELMFLK